MQQLVISDGMLSENYKIWNIIFTAWCEKRWVFRELIGLIFSRAPPENEKNNSKASQCDILKNVLF